jgi:hypothetical protein
MREQGIERPRGVGVFFTSRRPCRAHMLSALLHETPAHVVTYVPVQFAATLRLRKEGNVYMTANSISLSHHTSVYQD